METKRQIIGRSNLKALVFVLLITFCSSISVANEKVTSKPARYRVFSFRNISADTAKQCITDAGIGTVSKIPGSETLLVTAQADDLVKASAILKLIDSKDHYVFEKLATGEEIAAIPENDLIAEKIGNISIGTFSNPPVIEAGDAAIIDVHNDSLVIIATPQVVEKVKQQIKNTELAADINAVPQAAKDSGKDVKKSDEFFDDLMNSLAEADEKAKELGIDDQTEKVELIELKTQAQESFIELESVNGDLEPSGELVPKAEKQQPVEVEQKSEPVDSWVLETVEQEKAEDLLSVEVAEDMIELAEKVEPGLKVDLENKIAQVEPEGKKAPSVEMKKNSPYEPDSSALSDEELDLNLPEELEIIDLLDFAGKYLGLDYMYDPELIKGKVALRIQRKVKVKDLYPLIEQVLQSKGFVMTRRGNLVSVVPADRMLDIDPQIQIDSKKVQYGDAVITRVFKLEHIDTASAKNLLDNMQLGANITDIAESGTLIVTGFAYRMDRVEKLLAMVDQPGKAKMFKFKKLKYTMAATLAPQVKDLAEQLGVVSVTISQQVSDAAQPAAPRTARRPAARPATPPRTPTAPATGGSQPSPTKPEIFLDADERTNRILMIGLKEQLEDVEELIEALDVEQQDLRVMRVYDIENVGAEDVSEKLSELGITTTARQSTYSASRSRATTRSRITQPVANRPDGSTVPNTVTGTEETPEEEPQVIIIESTNSLLVNATPDQHNKIAAIIAYVDSEMREREIPYVIYPLENQDPKDLADSLQKLIEKTTKDKEGKVEQTVKTTEDDIVIVPEEKTFSLIVYASKRNQLWISNLIQKLDRRRPQVLINVSLVEITRNDAFEYDLNIIANMQDVVAENIVSTAAPDLTPISSIRNAFQASSNSGNLTGFYSNDRIQALLTAMDQKSYGRVLAQPKILVNDNEEGKISTSETQYVGEDTQSYPGEGTTPVTTTQYKPYEAKIELTIKPNISEGDLLRLEIEMVRQDFIEGTAVANKPKDTSNSNVLSIVTVPDGSTIILGGLTKLNQSRGGTKTPLLGDVPLIGNLFRSVSKSDKANHLYIFVKANILRPESAKGLSQLKEISESNRVSFEEQETKFQNYEDFVGIKSAPMEPINVLDTK